MLSKYFSRPAFYILFAVFATMYYFSMLCAIAQDDGTTANKPALDLVADVFYLFQFPIAVIASKLISDHPAVTIIGSALNLALYSLLTTLLIGYVTKRKGK
ncbi:hypothetical protein Dfer_4251 [Dyadobacter fermentans DSM 18053]|uniref:Uncharacterized protein n=1 Tax=Dyadobacter fermentans (strain ATCC 700827 / DSM 18053 / CIP 107007 / KCTC 52180 / NS114) TaxID=471854 RepID=C6W0Z8_DYAFD|nr:hypothetical protein Dfer_4251 [Dyadobacter fermentans DSM 18053]